MIFFQKIVLLILIVSQILDSTNVFAFTTLKSKSGSTFHRALFQSSRQSEDETSEYTYLNITIPTLYNEVKTLKLVKHGHTTGRGVVHPHLEITSNERLHDDFHPHVEGHFQLGKERTKGFASSAYKLHDESKGEWARVNFKQDGSIHALLGSPGSLIVVESVDEHWENLHMSQRKLVEHVTNSAKNEYQDHGELHIAYNILDDVSGKQKDHPGFKDLHRHLTRGGSFSYGNFWIQDPDTIPVISGCESLFNNGYPMYAVYAGVVADAGYVTDIGGWEKAVEDIIGQFNDFAIIYERGFGIQPMLKYIDLRTTTVPGEDWNFDHNCQSGGSASAKSDAGTHLSIFNSWVRNSAKDKSAPDADKAAVWALLTDCHAPAGTVGIAYVGTVASTNAHVSVNHAGKGYARWLTLGHEIGHNFGAPHNTLSGNIYNGDGIMSYGDMYSGGGADPHRPKLQRFYNKEGSNVCQVLKMRLAGGTKNRFHNLPISSNDDSRYTKSGDLVTFSGKSTCGNGVVDMDEECDPGFIPVGSTSEPCCTADCRFAQNGNCVKSDGECCDVTTCRIKPVTETCKGPDGATGICGNRVCLSPIRDICGSSSQMPCGFKNGGCRHGCGRNGQCNFKHPSLNIYEHNMPQGSICEEVGENVNQEYAKKAVGAKPSMTQWCIGQSCDPVQGMVPDKETPKVYAGYKNSFSWRTADTNANIPWKVVLYENEASKDSPLAVIEGSNRGSNYHEHIGGFYVQTAQVTTPVMFQPSVTSAYWSITIDPNGASPSTSTTGPIPMTYPLIKFERIQPSVSKGQKMTIKFSTANFPSGTSSVTAMYRSASAPAKSGGVIQNSITPGETPAAVQHELVLDTSTAPTFGDYVIDVFDAALTNDAPTFTSTIFTIEDPNTRKNQKAIRPLELLKHASDGRGYFLGEETIKIKWDTIAVIENVRIELYHLGERESVIDASTTNDGYYEWTPPRSLDPGHGYAIKISELIGGNTIGVSGFTEEILLLKEHPWLFVDSPTWYKVHKNGSSADYIGEFWRLGKNVEISFSSGSLFGKFTIEIIENRNNELSTVRKLTTPANMSSGTFELVVPTHISPKSFYTMKIKSLDSPDVSYQTDTFVIQNADDTARCGMGSYGIGNIPTMVKSQPNGTCAPCAVGTYNDMFGMKVCKPCPRGKVALQEGLQVCEDCPVGYFAASGSRCEPVSNCSAYPDFYQPNITECYPCTICEEDDGFNWYELNDGIEVTKGLSGKLPKIPDKWVRYFDPQSGDPYWHNERTDETTWDNPKTKKRGDETQ
eukprot:g2699.t1